MYNNFIKMGVTYEKIKYMVYLIIYEN